jgi:hypothetical protein
MMRFAWLPAALGFAAMALGIEPSWAQSRSTPTEASSTAPTSQATSEPDRTAAGAPGPVIFVVDSGRRVALVNVGSLKVRIIGRVGVQMTDIAFNPINKKLYGISYSVLYEISTSNFSTRLVARLGVNDANALVFDSAGNGYFAGYLSNRLYKVNVATGRVTIVGLTGLYYSAGDLTFYNDRLVMSAVYKTFNPNNASKNYLVTLNPANGAIIGKPVLMGIYQLYGLASTGKNELFGLAAVGTSNRPALYQLFPSASNVQDRNRLLRNLSTAGLTLIFGTAYNGNFQP